MKKRRGPSLGGTMTVVFFQMGHLESWKVTNAYILRSTHSATLRFFAVHSPKNGACAATILVAIARVVVDTQDLRGAIGFNLF